MQGRLFPPIAQAREIREARAKTASLEQGMEELAATFEQVRSRPLASCHGPACLPAPSPAPPVTLPPLPHCVCPGPRRRRQL